MNLYDQIGKDFINKAIHLFYDRVFEDPMIGYFFANSNKSHLITQQILFVSAMLGGPKDYQGGNLRSIHQPLKIRPAHFKRRQKILEEVLDELGLEANLRQSWLLLEAKLQTSIVRGISCNQ